MKPSAASVNLISGVGSGRETVIPASERKVVFSGIEALFSFHKESFLPALEAAAAPLMRHPAEGEELDADGQLSTNVTKGVAGIFLKHAAFMKMYSSYIKYVVDLLLRDRTADLPEATLITQCRELDTGRPTERQQAILAQDLRCHLPALSPAPPFLALRLIWLTSVPAKESVSEHFSSDVA